VNPVPAPIDAGNRTRTIFFSDPDIPRGTVIADVDVMVQFEKIDEAGIFPSEAGCPSTGGPGHQGGYTYNAETFYALRSPEGTQVVLVEDNSNYGGTGAATYSGGDYGGIVDVWFNDGAGAYPSGTPTSGVFLPRESLGAFNGEDPWGTWRLRIRDSVGRDPLCHTSYVLRITFEVPQFLLQRIGHCVLNDIDTPISYGMDNPFMAYGKGKLTALRFDYLEGGVAGWLYPADVTTNGQEWTGTFVNANSDGTIAIEPGTYRVYCFGPAGSQGSSHKVSVTK
jgi:hypothetical protein